MFIEITEYNDNTGDKIGTCLINTDDIYYVDNYDSSYRLWQVHLGQHENQENNVIFYVKKDSYEIIKNALIKENISTIC